MILAVDVAYHAKGASVAGVLFQHWEDDTPQRELVVHVSTIEEYIPGQFYRRELPCILELLKNIPEPVNIIIIDGYVYLGAEKQMGLGAHLFHTLLQKIPVVGVAKTKFHETPEQAEVYRGSSQRPLYVTAIGINEEFAKNSVARMHGQYRIPSLLKRVDQCCRSREKMHNAV